MVNCINFVVKKISRIMADNYIGRKMEEYFARPATPRPAHKTGGLLRLVTKNRSHRGYDPSFEVRDDQLRRIIGVNTRIASARNAQVLRFRPVAGEEARRMHPLVRMGGALPELHLPVEGEEPSAYIIVCSTVAEDRYVDIDLGISVQTMLLQAVEIGLNGIVIAAFDPERVRREFGLELRPLLIVALGRGTDRIEIREIAAGEPHAYYREEGRHIVPKVRVEDLILG